MVSRLSLLRSACALLSSLAPALLAQGVPPPGATKLDADVVVSAEAEPESAASLGVAATVIDAAEIAASKATTVLDLLRTVPGLDVVQSGGPGTVTSLFLRGTSSTQTLVLVDGVPLNSPYFGGTDLSAVSVANVERIEVVRGPFSALYGSEAIGGVVQIFTKRSAAPGFGGNARFALGNAGAKEGLGEIRFFEGVFSGTFGSRRTLSWGDQPNEFFAGTTLSGSLTAQLASETSLGITVRRESGRTGVPTDGANPTPRRSTTNDTTTLEVPLSLSLSKNVLLEASVRYTRDRPGYADSDDPFLTSSTTDARRAGARVALSTALGEQRITAGATWDRTLVSNESNFGVALDDAATRTFALFAEDRVALAKDRVVLTAGLRWDDHSAFGSAVSPRVTLSWRVTRELKLRAAAGSAFRAPSTGELYYPFSGNPSLRPEKSVGYEAGLEQTLAGGLVAELTGFWNDIRDLIDYDPQTFMDQNIGRARTRGVEIALRSAVGTRSTLRASYTYLDAKDLDTGTFLVRRPRHRASTTWATSLVSDGSASVTAMWVGARRDGDAVDFTKIVEDPSYLRVDAAITLPPLALSLAPFVRVTNVLGRNYEEVNGFPAPGRRFLAGLEAAF